MTVGYAGNGNVSSAAAQTVAPAYPASVAAGDALVLVRAAKPDTAALTTPAGWTLLDERAGGAGVFGNDTGPLRLCTYWREADGSETGSLTCSSTVATVDVQQAVILRYTRAADASWSVTASGGVDASAGTDWTVTTDAALGAVAGDLLQAALAWPTDSLRTWSAEAVSSSGATFTGTAVPATSGATGLGADMACRLHVFACTAGSSSGAVTYAGTVNSATNVTGPTSVVRLREVITGVSGVLGASLPAAVVTASGVLAVAGSLVANLPAVSAVLTGAVGVTGSLTATLPALTVAMSSGSNLVSRPDTGVVLRPDTGVIVRP